jgi:predicted membrane-bound mannosyltransferase
MEPMSPQLTSRILIALSICYGITVAILGALDSSALTIVAIIGALVLGGLWAVRSMLIRRDRST